MKLAGGRDGSSPRPTASLRAGLVVALLSAGALVAATLGLAAPGLAASGLAAPGSAAIAVTGWATVEVGADPHVPPGRLAAALVALPAEEPTMTPGKTDPEAGETTTSEPSEPPTQEETTPPTTSPTEQPPASPPTEAPITTAPATTAPAPTNTPPGTVGESPVPAPGDETPAPSPPAVLEPEAPALAEVGSKSYSWLIAVAVLLSSLVAYPMLRRRNAGRTAPPTPLTRIEAAGTVMPESTPATKLAALEAIGEAMLDAGYSVSTVRDVLGNVAEVNGFPHAEIVVLPTALFVSVRGLGELRTGAVSSGHARLNLQQIDDLDDVINEVRNRPSDPALVIRRIEEIRASPPPYRPLQRVVASGVLSAALSVMLDASWLGIGLAGLLGLLVGVTVQATESVQRQYQALVTVGISFAVSTVVLTLTMLGLDPGVLPSLIAPLVTFLPGALLTTGVVELATGQMMAGAGRLAAGFMQLVLLAAGVVGAATLVGVPRLELSGASQPIGPIGPWLAVAVFGASVVIYQNGRKEAIRWVVLVLYVAYGAQVIGDIFFGGVLSAFIGALAMTPMAALVSRQESGPAAFVSFLPGFWMLVPGALGLVGVASILDGDSAGVSTLTTTASTMVAIALGFLAGTAIAGQHRHSRHALL